MPPKLVLFVIDGTLIFKQTVHIQAFLHAFDVVFGIPQAQLQWHAHHGKTDLWILDEELRNYGVPPETIKAKIPRSIEVMVQYQREHMQEDKGHVLPYVPEFLAELERRGFQVGLVTGNIEGIAYTKMDHFGLGHFFRARIGGFGNEHSNRAELIKIALGKALRRGFDFNGANAVYIGDTPNDLKAARDAGVPAGVVLTGIYRRPDFQDQQPDVFLDDFSHAAEFFQFFEGLQEK